MDQQSFRKALGALKDSTTVGLAKVNSEFKELDIAIVKATNHVETLAKEKHIRTIFTAISASRPRADVAYCINSLARRLSKTHNWAVAIKTLIVIHRALREVDATFREELINYSRTRSHMLNLSHFKDDSSANAWDNSSLVRTYALYLEERLECFRVLKYDVETEHARTSELDTVDLLEHLPALQQLLFRLLACQPEGTAMYNSVIRYALSLVASESTKIYNAINGCTLYLTDKFFEMRRHDALRALEIYRKVGHQAERLSEFYEICKSLDLGREQKFVKIEQPPVAFIALMEEYVTGPSRTQSFNKNMVDADIRLHSSIPIMAIDHKNRSSDAEKPEAMPAVSVPTERSGADTANASIPAHTQVTDLLGFDDINEGTAKLEENNALALAIVPNNNLSDGKSKFEAEWELALISAASSDQRDVSESKLAGGLDKMMLDGLYEDAVTRRPNASGSYRLAQVAPNPFESSEFSQDPFHASNSVAPPPSVQMAHAAQQQAFMMQGQQQQSIAQHNNNPFGCPFSPSSVPSCQSHNPHGGFM